MAPRRRTRALAVATAVPDRILDHRALLAALLVCALAAAFAAAWTMAGSGHPLPPPRDTVFSVSDPRTEQLPLHEVRTYVEDRQERVDRSEDVQRETARVESPSVSLEVSGAPLESPRPILDLDRVQAAEIPTDVHDAQPDLARLLDAPQESFPEPAPERLAAIAEIADPVPAGELPKRFIEGAPRPRPALRAPAAGGAAGGPSPGLGAIGPLGIGAPQVGGGDALATTLPAVESALRWLANHQETDGGWRAEAHGGDAASSLAVTGLSTLAFLGAGNNTRRGRYRANVTRALAFIARHQRGDGLLTQPGANQYTHAICSIALCEAQARARDERFAAAARLAATWCARAQLGDGGWRYEPTDAMSDVSVTAWFVQAFKAARMAGIEADATMLARAMVYLDGLTDAGAARDSTGIVGYTWQGDQAYTLASSHSGGKPALTAAGMLLRQCNGVGVRNHLLAKGADVLRRFPPQWQQKDFYYWYYGTYAMHNMGGESRVWWNQRMRDTLLDHQARSGDAAGSWDPTGDRWGGKGGRVYCTALGALCLEVYYRYADALDTVARAPDIDELLLQGLGGAGAD